MGLSYEDCKRLGIEDLWPDVRSEAEILRKRFGVLIPQYYRITIPGWHPFRLNQAIGRHWSRLRKLKEIDRALIHYYAQLAQVDPAIGPRRVHLAITLGPRQRGGDPDSYWKGLLDSLVSLHLLVDDSKENVVLDPVEFQRGKEPETTIELFDL